MRRMIIVLLLAAVLLAAACAGGTSSPDKTRSVAPRPVAAPVTTVPKTTAVPAATSPSVPRRVPADACAGNRRGKLVLVRIAAQHLWMCQGPHTVRDTAVTTGVPGENTHTPTGRYRVQMPSKNTVLTLASGQTYDVKFWIPFDAPLFGFHDSSWQKFPYGSARYRTDGSHGCVHVPLAAIRFLFGWVDVGTRVHIV